MVDWSPVQLATSPLCPVPSFTYLNQYDYLSIGGSYKVYNAHLVSRILHCLSYQSTKFRVDATERQGARFSCSIPNAFHDRKIESMLGTLSHGTTVNVYQQFEFHGVVFPAATLGIEHE